MVKDVRWRLITGLAYVTIMINDNLFKCRINYVIFKGIHAKKNNNYLNN